MHGNMLINQPCTSKYDVNLIVSMHLFLECAALFDPIIKCEIHELTPYKVNSWVILGQLCFWCNALKSYN